MSLLLKGVDRLSQLEIDTDKDWQAKGMANLKSVAGSMNHGDIAFRGNDILERLLADAGKGYNFLRSRGPGLSPVWQDIESLVQYLTGSANRALAFDLSMPMPAMNIAHITGPGGGGSSSPVLGIPAPIFNGEARATTVNPVGGSVSHNDDVGNIDETVQANGDTGNDITLLPADGSINDYCAMGHAGLFDAVSVLVGQAGANYTLAYEYSRGAGIWGTLTIKHNSTNDWKAAGKGWLTFARPSDWATDTLAGLTLYWIRARAASISGGFVQPLGTRAWILVYA
ncbi:hypothetical protein ASJ33_04085 [Dehalococcoides mccartyi]|uniref:hypothetical protein n=1 Tax=Dehalococcoides mccartyi TaxID=61435 RepID=UPI0009095051|nr:hypothetical protein [Dehalococcoides mccartyi]APH12386.1 hypothetical protein ASJ33_04085 [Dehalococcoides mccartyi]